MVEVARVVVFGSAHQDVCFMVENLPVAGETVMASRHWRGLGGKGANQAVGAARAGARVAMVGAVGSDATGEAVVAGLDAHGIDTATVAVLDGVSGTAAVLVDSRGENQIVVGAGSVGWLDGAGLDRELGRVEPGDVVVVQCEIPAASVEVVVVEAARRGARVVLNLAPYTPLSDAALTAASVVVVNRVEALALTGADADDGHEALAVAAARRTRGACIVTAGDRGAYLARPGTATHHVAAHPARVVDTTGAGDAYVGALAADLAAGCELDAAMATASVLAAAAVERLGAQGSSPLQATATSVRDLHGSTEGATR